ncbi:TlpA family protein disulfide reductase [Nocardiopsis sp. NPDC050513]|uniref:TlpA family protein disulfide reductase n=1 Tax=Nocardiopsis sp. NPDC050513 TaxID=3364338 RepID=UPI0037B2E8B4
MTVLIAAVVLLTGLCLLNLLLTIGVIRRLREHTALIGAMGGAQDFPEAMLAAGERIGAFSAETLDGAVLTRDDLDGQTLIGVFAPGCPGCEQQMPHFVELAKSSPGGRDGVLALVVGGPEESAGEIARLAPVARLVREDHDGALARALGVRSFPAIARVGPEGRVVASGTQVRDLENAADV